MNFVFSPQADSSIQEPQPWGLDSLDMMDKPLTWEVRDMSPIKAIPFHTIATPRHPDTITFLERGLAHKAMVDPSHLHMATWDYLEVFWIAPFTRASTYPISAEVSPRVQPAM